MILRGRQSGPGSIRGNADRALSQALLLLLLAVVLPTALLVYFAAVALRNQQIAAREQFVELHRQQLRKFHGQLLLLPRDWSAPLDQVSSDRLPQERFAEISLDGQFDSALVFDLFGQRIYPDEAVAVSRFSSLVAERELVELAVGLAAGWGVELWLPEANRGEDLAPRVADRVGEQLRAGSFDDGLRLLKLEFVEGRFRDATDSGGRSLAANLLLLAIQKAPRDDGHEHDRKWLLDALTARLLDYSRPMPSAQRRFLMREVLPIRPNANLAALFSAEELAQRTAMPNPPVEPAWTTDGGVLALPASDRSLVGILSRATVERRLTELARAEAPPGANWKFVWDERSAPPELVAEPLSDWLFGASVVVDADPNRLAALASRRQTWLYFWLTALAILAVAAAGGWATHLLRRQFRLNQLKNDLLSTISHELKTPVASIRVLVDTLLAGDQPPERAREYLELIGHENRRLDRLVQSFLSFGRIQREQLGLRLQPTSLSGVVERAIQELGAPCLAPDCELRVDVSDSLPHVTGDADALVTVVANLLDNALKHSDAPKRVEISAEAMGNNVELRVRDWGRGFPPQMANKIFEPFFQIDRTLARASEGFGLGLSIARGIALAHHGSLIAQSEPGQGSEFRLSLPIANSQQPGATPSDHEPCAPRS